MSLHTPAIFKPQKNPKTPQKTFDTQRLFGIVCHQMTLSIGTLDNFQINRHRPVYRQISDRFREMIMSGELPAGHKLPSSQQIAVTVGSDAATVHTALRQLVKEGLITRQPRRGTFVRGRQEVLTQVGLFMGGSFRDSTRYERSLFGALEDLLRKSHLSYKVFVDPRALENQVDELPSLAKSIELRQIQGIVGVKMDRRSLRWLQKLPVPGAYHVAGTEEGCVSYDWVPMVQMSLERLRAQGCRSVALIAPFLTEMPDIFGGGKDRIEFLLKFTDVARDLGLEIHDELMRLPAGPIIGDRAAHRFGYEQFHALWKLPARPDGLLVYPDSVVDGTILAMAELGVSRDLRVVFHRNKMVDLVCPFPANWVQSDEADVAAALVEQLRKKLRGEPAPAFNASFQMLPSTDFKSTTTNPPL